MHVSGCLRIGHLESWNSESNPKIIFVVVVSTLSITLKPSVFLCEVNFNVINLALCAVKDNTPFYNSIRHLAAFTSQDLALGELESCADVAPNPIHREQFW